jgi:hypothetical protein
MAPRNPGNKIMSNTNTGGSAFPSKKRIYRAGYSTNEFEPVEGMTLRDYFAAKAMQGIIASEKLGDEEFATPEMYARDAYKYADAMLKAREA